MSVPACEGPGCDVALVQGVGRTVRYCSGRCRVAGHRARQREQVAAGGVPLELRAGRRWVRWVRVARGGSSTKRPVTASGRAASSMDPATWGSWSAVQRSRVGQGVGVVLAGEGILAFDLDDCLDERGVVSGAAAELLAVLPRTWVEVSVGGRGLHVFGRGVVGQGRRFVTAGGLRVELYDRGRFLTVSGRPLVVAPLADVSGALARLEAGVVGGSLDGWRAREEGCAA